MQPEERTVSIGIFQVIRTAGTAIGPLYVGYLTQRHAFWVTLEIYCGLRLIYEFLVWYHFWGYKTREEREIEYSMVALADYSEDDDDDAETHELADGRQRAWRHDARVE